MAVEGLGGGERNGVAFLVSAGVVYEIIAAACSSPQTAELNASTRAKTLMKWVHLGVAQAVLFTVAAAYYDRRNARPIVAGSALAIGLLYWQYAHAIRSGLSNGGPPTETYQQNGNANPTAAASRNGAVSMPWSTG